MNLCVLRCLFIVFFVLSISDTLSVARRPQQLRQVTIQMNGYSPDIDDAYVQTSLLIEPGYIVRFEPIAQADRIHHILLFGCEFPAQKVRVWKGFETCAGMGHILYAWARNAPDLILPEDVAFSVGHDWDNIRYLVMQVHYAHPFVGNVLDYSGITVHLIDDKPKYLAAVFLFVSNSPILPGYSHFQTNVSCVYQGITPLHPFAFRTHAHGYGRVISAYFKNEISGWNMIGKRNPQWPQLFQKIETNPIISSGDLMAATCVYDSSQLKTIMRMGNTGGDEMCNFYMMFYYNSSAPNPFPLGEICPFQEQKEIVNKEYPDEGASLLPPRPEWEHKAHQSNKPFGLGEGLFASSVGGISLGQVTSLAFDPYENLVIFHRAGRVWDESSFDTDGHLRVQSAIRKETILVSKPNADNNALLLIAKYGSDQ